MDGTDGRESGESEATAVRRERERLGGSSASFPLSRNPLRMFGVPEDDGEVLGSTGDPFCIRRGCEGDDSLFMPRTHARPDT